ncbi:hypothetical protein KQX54_013910 [Cotesia glomerata]|uniref:Uncharacterized protein n=1 Tax=Cotesia glomerata TaxID=32391 RepID=A0AAV7I4P1_COTGL|nr:hypothetical protein KQX54_013910 [Cotesia glomerata]
MNHDGAKEISSSQVGDDSYKSVHFPVNIKLRPDTRQPKISSQQNRIPQLKLTWNASYAPQFTDFFYHSQHPLLTNVNTDADSMARNLHEAIYEAANNAGLMKCSGKEAINKTPSKPWEDANLHAIKASLVKHQISDSKEVLTTVYSLTSAEHLISHHLLWTKLFKLGIRGKIIRTVRAIYEKANIQLKMNEENSKLFEITEGILQVGKLSLTLLFILYIADLIDFLDDNGSKALTLIAMHNKSWL